MQHDGIDLAYAKYATWAIYGPRVETTLAREVIRRTDAFFRHGRCVSPYQRAVRTLLGAPCEADGVGGARASATERRGETLEARIRAYQDRWGWLASSTDDGGRRQLALMTNGQVDGGTGWCHADGTIALCEEIERAFPTSIWSECEAIAAAFPDLRFAVAYWGRDDETPSAGFRVERGRVSGTAGDDPDLFAGYGDVDFRTVRTVATDAARTARAKLPTTSALGDRTPDGSASRTPAPGLPDEVVLAWRQVALDLGLVAA